MMLMMVDAGSVGAPPIGLFLAKVVIALATLIGVAAGCATAGQLSKNSGYTEAQMRVVTRAVPICLVVGVLLALASAPDGKLP